MGVLHDCGRLGCRAKSRGRESDDEQGAFADPAADGRDRAAVQFDDVFGDRQTETETPFPSRHLRPGLAKGLEDLRQPLGADTS